MPYPRLSGIWTVPYAPANRAKTDTYLWFSQRFPRFVYIDRVAIAPTMRGRGYPSDGMVCWPVSPRVGNVKNNDPSLIEPIAAAG